MQGVGRHTNSGGEGEPKGPRASGTSQILERTQHR